MSSDDRAATPSTPRAARGSRDRSAPGGRERSAIYARREMTQAMADRYADMRTMIVTCAVLGSAVALAATAQAVIVLGVPEEFVGQAVPLSWDLGRRIFINLITVITTLLIVSQLRIETRSPTPAAALVLAAGVGVAALRGVMQIAVGIYSQHDVLPALADAAVSGVMISLIIAFAVYVTRSQQRVRRAERTSHLSTAQSSQALVTLLRNQARARHALAADTHQSLEAQFARITTDLNDITKDTDGLVQLRLRAVSSELADVADGARRGLALFSHPEALEHGLVPAVRAFISAVPNPIAVRLRVSDPGEIHAAAGTGPAHMDRRAVLLQTVIESTLNALEFCRAQRIDVEIGVSAGMVRVAVSDDAAEGGDHGFVPGMEGLRRQVSALGGRLESEVTTAGACRVVAFLPKVPAFA